MRIARRRTVLTNGDSLNTNNASPPPCSSAPPSSSQSQTLAMSLTPSNTNHQNNTHEVIIQHHNGGGTYQLPSASVATRFFEPSQLTTSVVAAALMRCRRSSGEFCVDVLHLAKCVLS
ncbi:hypothetical protein GQX74_011822 [Glossina fuscipes]|nr:hypothetical protein GQX74_011822 [Glossina fuscipes]